MPSQSLYADVFATKREKKRYAILHSYSG